jgi:hypothetical protein
MRRLAVVLALAVLVAPTAAHADELAGWQVRAGDRAKCVTSAEANELWAGFITRQDAEAILDGPGYATTGIPNARDYRPCGLTWDRGRFTVLYWPGGSMRGTARGKWREADLELPHDHPRYDPATPSVAWRPFGGIL